MSSQNGLNLGKLLQCFREQNYEGLPRFQVFSYVLNPNMELIQENPSRAYGVVIPVGSFYNIKDAVECRDLVAFNTKAATFIRELGHYKTLSLVPGEDTIVVNCNEKTQLSDMQKDINQKQKEGLARRARQNESLKLREDPTTTEYFIQELYQYSTRVCRIAEAEKSGQVAREEMEKFKMNIKEFISNNPGILSEWESECRDIYKDKRELHIYDILSASLKKFLQDMADDGDEIGLNYLRDKQLVDEKDIDPSVKSDFDILASSSKGTSNDDSDEDFQISVRADQVLQQMANSGSGPSSSSNVVISDSLPLAPKIDDDGWIKAGPRRKTKKNKPTQRSQNFRNTRGRGGNRGNRK